MKCPKCGHKAFGDLIVCIKCGYNVNEEVEKQKFERKTNYSLQNENVNSLSEINETKKEQITIPSSIGVLRVFAWLDLLVSIIFSIVIWTEYSTELSRGYYTSEKVANPYMIVLGIVVLLQGIFVCTLFLVIAHIAESLIFIRHNTRNLNN